MTPETSTTKTRLLRQLHRPVPPAVSVGIGAVGALLLLWVGTLNLTRVEHENAHRAAQTSSRELLETYEAQVVRVLREIDQTLRSLQYAYQLRGDARAAFEDLSRRDLLPPDLVFGVSLLDTASSAVATNRSSPPSDTENRYSLALARDVDTLVVEPAAASADEWQLRFSRRLTRPDGSFGGIALVEVEASFFVSGYDASKLGEHGVLAILGRDGAFRARRTGDRISAGGRVSYGSVVSERAGGETETRLLTSRWDGVRRYTSARGLFDFPVAVVVGLSEREQLAPAAERSATYLRRATAASLLLIVIAGVLGRLSWKLERLRRREREAQTAHARKVEHLAYHDSLTGLPNRSFLAKLLADRVRLAERYGKRFAVLFLDLDGFKEINDTLGHDAGDELLREGAARLEASLRDSDTVARMGGDEFVVLVPEVESDHQVDVVARKVLASLSEPFVLLGKEFTISASVGISLYPEDGEDEQALMKHADIAMYAAKDAGKNDYRFFSASMGRAARERLDLEASLRRALQNEEFDLHYQARRELETGRITGMEALLRWEHPERGSVRPGEFLALAEETGLILPIGRWVLKTACRQNVAWQADGLPPLNVAVNLSARQFFDEGLVDDVAAALAESGLRAELLELEICESILARDSRRTVPVLRALKQLGVRITVDNFGTGYSSLALLRQLPLDTIKIDRVFLRPDAGDTAAHEVAGAVVMMGRTLSASVVAHGVETREQAAFLRGHACSEVQGFFFDRPAPAADVTRLLRKGAVKPDLAAHPGR